MIPVIRALAGNTFKEGVRDRLFLALGVFAGVVLGSSFIVGPLSLGEQVRITQDIGLASISILGFLVAVLVGTGIVYREVEKRTIYTVLSKPVERWQFILGKFLGLSAIVGLLVAGMAVVLVVMNRVVAGTFGLHLVEAIVLIWVELILLTALSVLMSTLCSPILGAIFTFLLYVIGHTSADLKDLAARFGSQYVKVGAGIAYYALPNLEYLNVKSKVVHGVDIHADYIAFACCYGLAYSLIFLLLAALVFERKEFH
jgi:ABC-type transport system involved in multi-copper enzyme maturation permease subunit